jgi:hypothetical protein
MVESLTNFQMSLLRRATGVGQAGAATAEGRAALYELISKGLIRKGKLTHGMGEFLGKSVAIRG